MRIVVAVVYALTASALVAASPATAVAQVEQEMQPVKHHRAVKRPDPENATMPEKRDWISQTLGDVLEGIDDLGKPLRDPPR